MTIFTSSSAVASADSKYLSLTRLA